MKSCSGILSLLLCALLFVVPAVAEQTEGEQLYQSCAACHGPQAQGIPALKSPALAGLNADYITRQLIHFKTRIRGNNDDPFAAQMLQSVKVLADEQAIKQVADYLATLDVPKIEPSLEGDAKRGQNLYNGSCGACHGASGQGNPALHAPRLANQHTDYLVRQLRAFKQGKRGTEQADKYGRQMAMMATSLNIEKDIPDILSYLQTRQEN
ncbi:c-type cytochrome [Neptunicella marina]|uniref:C-type cytochrome n=1 Tax=Neptunicella marina TaxID=2125989 RepID=A0A8J6ISK6_9ALTE|nr:c-type cytochrome [Neptunicella marina]MBC3765524.1 c-type cytochrome [Neptunicella marina]